MCLGDVLMSLLMGDPINQCSMCDVNKVYPTPITGPVRTEELTIP